MWTGLIRLRTGTRSRSVNTLMNLQVPKKAKEFLNYLSNY
jgi:hypothetical protein